MTNRTPFPSLLRFTPVIKRIRWGGRRLETHLGKSLGGGEDYAESWEISAHQHGPSIIEGTPLAGLSLAELAQRFPDELLGPNRRSDEFPLLVKFLDAHDRLSVQVHPNDEQAIRYNPAEHGKTEAWVILDVGRDSRLYAGLRADIDREKLTTAIHNGTLEDCLHSIRVAPGDCVFIPAGTVHAIGEGILLAEIQQSSNLTFRLFDWGRLGTDGLPRELHVEEALDCIDFDRGPVHRVNPEALARNPKSERLVRCPYFELQRHTITRSLQLETRDSYQVLMLLKGTAIVTAGSERVHAKKGQSFLIPACEPYVNIDVTGPNGTIVLEAFVPA